MTDDDKLRQVAAEAVEQTLRRMGLDPDDAQTAADIHDLKSLISAWRATKRTVWQTVARVATVAALGALAAGAFFNIRN
jgi:hypothetical protein